MWRKKRYVVGKLTMNQFYVSGKNVGNGNENRDKTANTISGVEFSGQWR